MRPRQVLAPRESRGVLRGVGGLGGVTGGGGGAGAGEPAAEVAHFPGDEDLCGDTDGGVGTDDDANEDGEQEGADALATKEEHGGDGDQEGDGGVERTGHGLDEGGVDVIREVGVR